MFIWKMTYNFQSNYNYTTKIRQICSEVILVHLVIISLDSLEVNLECVYLQLISTRRINIRMTFIGDFKHREYIFLSLLWIVQHLGQVEFSGKAVNNMCTAQAYQKLECWVNNIYRKTLTSSNKLKHIISGKYSSTSVVVSSNWLS